MKPRGERGAFTKVILGTAKDLVRVPGKKGNNTR